MCINALFFKASDLARESRVHLLQLNPVELATQLMVEDFTAFRRIEASEYVDDLFERSSNSGKEVSCCCLLLLLLLLL